MRLAGRFCAVKCVRVSSIDPQDRAERDRLLFFGGIAAGLGTPVTLALMMAVARDLSAMGEHRVGGGSSPPPSPRRACSTSGRSLLPDPQEQGVVKGIDSR